MSEITISIPSDVDTQNAKNIHAELASQMKNLTADVEVTLDCDAETPSILAEQLGYACAAALRKAGHKLTLGAPWDGTFKLDTDNEHGVTEHG